MVGGFLVQMWPLFDQYLGGLKTVAVSFEEKSAIEFPDLAFCDSRTFKRKFATTSSVTDYNATAYNLEEDVFVLGMFQGDGIYRTVSADAYEVELVPTVFNGYCKLYQFKGEIPIGTYLSKLHSHLC